MSTQKALVMQGSRKASLVSDRPIPKPRSKYLGVKVTAVALNPTDWKHIMALNTSGSLVGCDFAGTVETLGERYDTKWNVGDRICGFVHGGDKFEKTNGAFAEHIVASGDLSFPIPASWSDEEAATLPLGALTCGQGLFQAMKLDLPSAGRSSGEPVLVYGGSTASGALGIQYLKLAGYKPITTCSPRNFDYVKSLGAAAVFDYHDPKCAEQIKRFANGNLKHAWDCIATGASAKICADALVSGGQYASLSAVALPRKDVSVTSTLLYTIFGEPVDKGFFKTNGIAEDYTFGKMFAVLTRELMQDGKIKPHRPRIMPGGLEGITAGLDMLRFNQVSGEKLVYRIS